MQSRLSRRLTALSVMALGREMTLPVIVWRGDHMLPDHQQGIVVFGTPLGREEFVKSQLRCKLQEHSLLLQCRTSLAGMRHGILPVSPAGTEDWDSAARLEEPKQVIGPVGLTLSQ